MQLPRVVIAAVFIVIGALIAIPALFNGDGSAAPAASSTSASPSPSGTSPSPTPTTQPVTASIGSVACPARTANVRLRNTGTRKEDFSIEKNDDSAAAPGTIGPGQTRTVAVKLREDRSTRVTVRWANKRIESGTLKANCKKAGGAAPSETPPSSLPHTGPDDVLWARAATGGAVILTGAIIFWWGGIWPRRRERMFADKKAD
ncbi:hypothetical protein E1293_26040 [Actinomadura darangshiensis]|uniref:Uncharacterized protein n=1 Tax=Actinomadura darangshiensis TaxID=705336 RepID=A0A4R5AW41_9ACTN|nr:hypothetical protein [Actinomadura darangshiensis]TDD77658.1 hypothetical protein E1293_26040 [Actinomadura darangshiensis]